jgi:hypothetical protein
VDARACAELLQAAWFSSAKFVEATGMVSVPAGRLNDDVRVRPSMHVFVSSKVPWVDLNDDLPKHEKWVPGFVPRDFES